jgi:hypothetical protein
MCNGGDKCQLNLKLNALNTIRNTVLKIRSEKLPAKINEGDKAVVCPVAIPSLHYTKYRVQPGVLVMGEAVALTVRIKL